MADPDEARRAYEDGLDAYRAGEYEEAFEALNRARDLYAEAGNRHGESDALNDLGVVCIQLEDWNEANQLLNEALTIRIALQDRSAQGITLGNLGMMYDRQGDKVKAAEAYEQAVEIFRELGERGNEKAVARQLGKLEMKRGKFLDALSGYHEELEGEEAPSSTQKLARHMFRLMGWLSGGGPIEDAIEDGADVIEVLPKPDED